MEKHIHTTDDRGKQFYMDYHDKGKVIMLNLLKFKSTADYTDSPHLKPETEITGKQAYNLYMEATLPEIKKAGSKILYYGKSQQFLIGPESEQWDAILLVEHESAMKFIEFAQNETYLKTMGHRTAAIEDSRLLPSSAFGQ